MSAVLARRGFLQGLVHLPLIGGSLSLLGTPSGSAEPVTTPLLLTYADWLFFERRILLTEMCQRDPQRASWAERWTGNFADHFHFWPGDGRNWTSDPQPSARAALVLSTVGCDWRCNEGRRNAWTDTLT